MEIIVAFNNLCSRFELDIWLRKIYQGVIFFSLDIYRLFAQKNHQKSTDKFKKIVVLWENYREDYYFYSLRLLDIWSCTTQWN